MLQTRSFDQGSFEGAYDFGYISGTPDCNLLRPPIKILFLLVPYGYIIIKIKKRIPKEMTAEFWKLSFGSGSDLCGPLGSSEVLAALPSAAKTTFCWYAPCTFYVYIYISI